MAKIFIDGGAGTTGLNIKERLSEMSGIELITLPEELRKDVSARKEAMNSADVVFFCLPDDAAKQADALIENRITAVIDASTVHRVCSGWEYGFPELYGRRERIKNSKRIANPGCHASGFIALTEPLIRNKMIKKRTNLTCFSLTGYTGGGKKMIADYENKKRDTLLSAPRQYGLSQSHKHLPEMSAISGLKGKIAFCPIVGDFPRGMEVTVPLFKKDLRCTEKDIREVFASYYCGDIVKYNENADENGFLSANAYAGKDSMEISVFGNSEEILLVARFDNLGKGACGAAIQNMNILLGKEETNGLIL